VDQIYIEDPTVPVLADHTRQTAGGLMHDLDQRPSSGIRRLLSNLRGARAKGDGVSLIMRPAMIRAGRTVVICHRMRPGERGLLTIGNRTSIEVGNGRTVFLAPPGITRIGLAYGSPTRHCQITIRAFDPPRLRHLRWSGPIIVGKPVVIGWCIENAARARLQIELNDRLLFDSLLSDHTQEGEFLGLSGEQIVQFEQTGNARVRLIAELPSSPWRDLRRRIFPILVSPVFPPVPSFDEISVPRQAHAGDDIPIRWRLSGAERMILQWADGDIDRERTLSPSGETVIVVRSLGFMDLRFRAEPMFPPDPLASFPNSRHEAAGQSVSRTVEVRLHPPEIKVSRQRVRGLPLSLHDIAYEIRGASEVWLVRPRRGQSVAIEPSGVMSFRIGKIRESITIIARSMAGDESSATISLIPCGGFLGRLLNATV
jgi:hypothetical protein